MPITIAISVPSVKKKLQCRNNRSQEVIVGKYRFIINYQKDINYHFDN